ncbi:MAG TPA: aminotransferase class I/II-fold pyridoxal phosphate-dependent enzyme [Pirellulales bacterium]|nr:aminotransferase class I/II-fold pyridoxal phosphate-dependent enzyme [Pirellulales bacterium]
MTSPLNRMLTDRSSGRFLQFYAELARNLPNAYCQLESIDGRECVINGKRLVNFNAINYLGLENHPRLIHAAQEALARWGTLAGSARAAAELDLFGALEDRIAGWLGVDNVIVYTTVTLANHGVIPLLMRKGSLLLMDQEVHNSVQRSGVEARGAGATVLTFPHDDFAMLEAQLREHRPQHDHVMIALDGIYSMSGTYLNLPRYQELAAKYGAMLYVDDAHGFGVVGPEGRGIVSHHGADYENTIYVASLEKGLASLGGFVVVPKQFRDYFRFNSYTYTFTGQLPPPYLASSLAAFDVLEEEGPQRLNQLRRHINHTKQELTGMGFEIIGEDQPFPLIMVKTGELHEAAQVSQFFYDEGIHILSVGFPVVPMSRGSMLRISLSASHTDAQIERLLAAFRKFRSQSRPVTTETGATDDLLTGTGSVLAA